MSGPVVPSGPFLRPAGEGTSNLPVPHEWETHSAGWIAGEGVEVVYDPARHDVVLVWDSCFPKAVADGVMREGWSQLARTDDAQIWSRDRMAVARRQLADLAQVSHECVGLGR